MNPQENKIKENTLIIEKDDFFESLEKEFLEQAKEVGFTEKQAKFLFKKCKRSGLDFFQ